jgi:glyoxylate/hydroxypyruvate reductase
MQERLNILLCGRLDEAERVAWGAALHAALPAHRFVTDVAQGPADSIDVALVANPPPGALQGLPSLRLVQSLWAGVDRLLADATRPAAVPLARMVDPAMNAAMAQTALWAVLSLHRGFFRYQQQQAKAQWRQLPQTRADDLNVAVLGFGQMGRAVAGTLAHAGYRVAAWTRTPHSAPEPGIVLHAGAAALPALLAGTQIVINLLPLTETTRGLVNARFLAALPAGAALVNLARGGHVVEADLLAALDTGHLAHAVLDVFNQEPLPPEHRFWLHPRVTVLPHAAASTDPRSAAAVVADNITRLQQGLPLRHLVNTANGY